MSTETDDAGEDEPTSPVKISLSLGESGDLWVARDEETGIASQGSTRQDALENLDEAVAGYYGAGNPPTEDELRDMGIDPENNVSGTLPDILE